jgi:hypothetical protein
MVLPVSQLVEVVGRNCHIPVYSRREKNETKDAEIIDTYISFCRFWESSKFTRRAKRKRAKRKRAPCLFSYHPRSHSEKERSQGKKKETQGIRKRHKSKPYDTFFTLERLFFQKSKPYRVSRIAIHMRKRKRYTFCLSKEEVISRGISIPKRLFNTWK